MKGDFMCGKNKMPYDELNLLQITKRTQEKYGDLKIQLKNFKSMQESFKNDKETVFFLFLFSFYPFNF